MNSFFLETILGRIILGVFTSYIFVFLLLKYMRPKMKISKNIWHRKDIEDNKYYYVFKIVNMSRFVLYNLKFRLHKKTPYLSNNGGKINFRMSRISLENITLDHFSKFKSIKNYGDHAVLIRTSENLDELIKYPNISVVLSVMARHSFSNLTASVTQDFNWISQIHKDKEFKFGKHLDVILKKNIIFTKTLNYPSYEKITRYYHLVITMN